MRQVHYDVLELSEESVVGMFLVPCSEDSLLECKLSQEWLQVMFERCCLHNPKQEITAQESLNFTGK